MTSVPEKGFLDCTNLKSIKLGQITYIAIRGFMSCTNLGIALNAPNLAGMGAYCFMGSGIIGIDDIGKVTTIGSGGDNNGGTFFNCTKLEYINLNSPLLTTVNRSSFQKCTALRKIVLSSSVTGISQQAFAYDVAIEVFVCHATTPPTLGYNVFGSTNSTFIVYVPDASVTAYQEATNWSTYASRIKPLSEYVES